MGNHFHNVLCLSEAKGMDISMIRYKIDVFKELSNNGFNQTRIQRENLLPRQTITNIKAGKSITLETLNKICVMCNLQPGDIIEVVLTDEERMKYNI